MTTPATAAEPAPTAPEGSGLRVAIVGATATGKSDLALALAERLDGEIINADASQLYRGMDIGTAKLSPAERRGIRHYQLDVLTVREEASVAAYQKHARADLARIEQAGAHALIVGGSGLYVRALTDDLDFPGTDPRLRAALEDRAEREGIRALWEELRQVDPVSAERIEPANGRRVVRALEVYHLTGRPFSASLPRYEDVAPTVHLALRPPREALNARIDRRAQRMFASGLIEETEKLLEEGLADGPTASRAIGYSQAMAVISGQMSKEEASEATALATRQLASRQFKWFRRDPRVQWLDCALHDDGSLVAGEWDRLVAAALRLTEQAQETAQERAVQETAS